MAKVEDYSEDYLETLTNLGADFFNIPPFNDEPKLFHLSCLLSSHLDYEGLNRAGGSSASFARAARKAMGESIERINAAKVKVESPREATFSELQTYALDPDLFEVKIWGARAASPTRDDMVEWVDGFELTSSGSRDALIPSQLVFLPYSHKGLARWFQNTSNGLAAGVSAEHAIWNAILELIERQTFLEFWLAGGCDADRIQLETKLFDNPGCELGQLLVETKRYRLDASFVVLPTVARSIRLVICILADKTGANPRSTIGLKASHDVADAALGALEEAHQLRPWLRELSEDPPHDVRHLVSIEDRARWWLTDEAQEELLSRVSPRSRVTKLESRTQPIPLGQLIAELADEGITPYGYAFPETITHHSTVRVVIPQFHPLFFDEDFATYSHHRADAPRQPTRHPIL